MKDSYVEGSELFEYFKNCAVRWNCMQYIKLKHRVIEARWDEPRSRWRIKVEVIENASVIDDECDVLLSCTGILKLVHQIFLWQTPTLTNRLPGSKWKWPEIGGLDQFTGPVLHSARWDANYDFHGKTAAVLGAGSSAIQIVPSLQPGKRRCSALLSTSF